MGEHDHRATLGAAVCRAVADPPRCTTSPFAGGIVDARARVRAWNCGPRGKPQTRLITPNRTPGHCRNTGSATKPASQGGSSNCAWRRCVNEPDRPLWTLGDKRRRISGPPGALAARRHDRRRAAAARPATTTRRSHRPAGSPPQDRGHRSCRLIRTHVGERPTSPSDFEPTIHRQS